MRDWFEKLPSALRQDRRLLACRDGVAASYLEGLIEAARFIDGTPAHVTVGVVDLKSSPDDAAGTDTQLLYGEPFTVFGTKGAWCWGQAGIDGYVGWVKREAVSDDVMTLDLTVSALTTYVYPEPDLKTPPTQLLSMGAFVTKRGETVTRNTPYVETELGWIIAHHLAAHDVFEDDFVNVAEMFINVPYLWAGRSGQGIDCSALIQLAMQHAGRFVLRDTDMQEQTIGRPIDLTPEYAGLRRGDLIFWSGHVGVMRDDKTLLHANGASMTVKSEPLIEAVDRIAALYQKPRCARRP